MDIAIDSVLSIMNHTISHREIEILDLLSMGFTHSEIAKQLYLSVHTVNTHTKNIQNKLNARNTAHAVRMVFASVEPSAVNLNVN